MSDFLNIKGIVGNEFSIGLKSKRTKISVTDTTLSIDKVLDMDSQKIINVATPTNSGDVTTKGYVDGVDATINTRIDGVEGIQDALISTIGANNDGSNPGYSATNYIVNTDSTIVAISKIDTALKANADNDGNQDLRMDTIVTSAGFNNDGTKGDYSSNNYIDNTDSLVTAVGKLDAQVGTNANNISTNTSDISGLDTRLTTAEGNIDTLQTDASNIQTEVDNIETGLGFNANGTKPNFTSTNYIGATDSVITAVNKIDTQIKQNSDTITTNSSDISTLQSDMTTAQGDISDLQSGKIDKVTSPVVDDIAVLTADGSLSDSGTKISDLALASDVSSIDSRLTTVEGDVSGLQTDKADITYVDSTFIPLTQKASANGVASLGSDGKVPTSQLPSSIMGGLNYHGTWDASGGTYPTPTDVGDFWIISVAGTLGGVHFDIGDWLIWEGNDTWNKIDNTQDVNTVFGRTGNVVGVAGDYSASQVTNDSSTVSGTYVSDALDTLKSGIDTNTTDISTINSEITTIQGDISDLQSDKANKIVGGTTGDILTLSAGGDIVDSSKSFTTTISASSPSDSKIPTEKAVRDLVSANVPSGVSQTVAITIGTTSTTSTFSIPNGAIIESVKLVVSSAYDSNATISADVGSVNILSTTESDPATPAQYSKEDIASITTGAVVSVTLANATQGSAKLYVKFIASPLV